MLFFQPSQSIDTKYVETEIVLRVLFALCLLKNRPLALDLTLREFPDISVLQLLPFPDAPIQVQFSGISNPAWWHPSSQENQGAKLV